MEVREYDDWHELATVIKDQPLKGKRANKKSFSKVASWLGGAIGGTLVLGLLVLIGGYYGPWGTFVFTVFAIVAAVELVVGIALLACIRHARDNKDTKSQTLFIVSAAFNIMTGVIAAVAPHFAKNSLEFEHILYLFVYAAFTLSICALLYIDKKSHTISLSTIAAALLSVVTLSVAVMMRISPQKEYGLDVTLIYPVAQVLAQTIIFFAASRIRLRNSLLTRELVLLPLIATLVATICFAIGLI